MAKNTTAEKPQAEKICGIAIRRSAETKVLYFNGAKIHFNLISPSEHVKLRSECRLDARGNEVDFDKLQTKILCHCIVKWENVNDENGNPCELNEQNISDLPIEVSNAVATEIFKFIIPAKTALPLETSPATSK